VVILSPIALSGPMILAGRYVGRFLCAVPFLRRELPRGVDRADGRLVRCGALPELLMVTPDLIRFSRFDLRMTVSFPSLARQYRGMTWRSRRPIEGDWLALDREAKAWNSRWDTLPCEAVGQFAEATVAPSAN
jgi:hypothetical protein